MKQGLALVGMQSLKRTTDWVHAMAKRDSDAAHAEAYGQAYEPTSEDGNMSGGDIYLGDITVAPPEPPKVAGPVKRLSTAALIAAALAGGGLGLAGSMLSRPTEVPSAVAPADTVSTLEVDRD